MCCDAGEKGRSSEECAQLIPLQGSMVGGLQALHFETLMSVRVAGHTTHQLPPTTTHRNVGEMSAHTNKYWCSVSEG